ncbi:hypothetical protein HNV11_06665 [Spirosoma taeanense]|uniref:Uncharacterized protein n=1 Tax=Spirosoma taeanense TaxID=2735870 RepID=A0A6M5Y6K0_9BACT|nr:hypothetical protein [Spirosoma taeanense]QJW89094.1 hypothetical protein HNV11_06665 [Spirosoma taeanense]
MLRFLFIVGLLTLSLLARPARAQLAQSMRIEIPSDPNEAESFDVTPLGDRGVLMTIRTGSVYDNTPIRYQFQKFNTNLKPLWRTEFRQDIKFRPVLSYDTDQYAYHLFRAYDTNRFQFLRLHLEDGHIETFEGSLIEQFDVQHFKIMGSQAYIGGYHHSRPVVLAFSFFDQSVKVLPGMYVNRMELSSLEIDEARQEVNVLVHSSRRRCTFSIRTYNYDSKLLRTINFDGAENSLISGKLLPVNEQESLLVGNYSTDCTPYSQGIYVTRIRHNEPADVADEAAVNGIQYIEFSQLQNFFNYLKPHRQQKLLARAMKKKEEGKDYKFRYRLLVHDLQPTPDGLTLVAEVYYPQYRGAALAYGGYLRGADRYEGFRYTHAFICGFDRQGQLLWDNCLPIKELLSPDLTEMVQVSQQGNRMVLAYPNDGEITTEVIQGSKVLKETEKFKLQTNAENEKVTFSAQDNLMAWYDRHFLACGFQKIAPSKNYANQREVFYLNKLTYNEDAKTATPASATTRKSAGSER